MMLLLRRRPRRFIQQWAQDDRIERIAQDAPVFGTTTTERLNVLEHARQEMHDSLKNMKE